MRENALWSLPDLRRLETEAERQGLDLMQRAARATADWVGQHLDRDAHILVAAGPGNNGGDALYAALLLMQAGYSVDILLPQAATSPQSQAALQAIRQAGGIPLQQLASDYPTPDLLIDGLFGIGLSRPLSADWVAVITRLNQLSCLKLALDCPSGLDPYTGQAQQACMDASHTLTFLCHKPGLFYAAGADHAGQIELAELDCPQALLPPAEGYLNRQDASPLQRRRDSHKGSNGTVCIIGGNRGMLGAALLAGRAALAAGAGKVHVLTLDGSLPVDPACPELMLQHADPAMPLPSADVLALGPGLGQDKPARQWLALALASSLPLVLDADALNLLACSIDIQQALAKRPATSILTPHPAEAARLLACSTATVQGDRLAAARQLAERFQCTVLLKGAGSLIVTVGQPYLLNTSGGPALATAGQGDVLTGLIAALLAQGMDARAASSLAARVHGLAGDEYQQQAGGPIGLTASATSQRCSNWLNRLL
ncbi:bifunctional ADP-dependent NAD(P)H-hydrate dehydratase/NAD(P)H-hydrate epimerase [Aquitalea sp. FJL05]|uniref:NAD(P)H-hydrate dehydratase n=1 Tax=Aquitalea TaxID=407217 RepID=UPI000F59BAE2|nr:MULTISPECIES: NAD(P)H-hydrate dehydratase [Aquitalea]RQO76269.1 bifunctional ADP-dependent NAD(P)H-hydrate dehydratase/NAD(P)H-hydrate epimerase [Aquitalea sp. FJL05]